MCKISQLFTLLASLIVFQANHLEADIVKILIQGDTQKIMNPNNGKQDNFVPLMAKVLTDPITRDADFILQMGDIVESDKDNSDRPQQYIIAREGWRQFDGKIPYVLNLGNNDDAAEYFAVFNDLPEPFSKNSNSRNFAYKLSAGGVDWLIISMRFHEQGEDNTDEVDWAINLIEANENRKVIFIKHEVNENSGIVNKLKRYPNVVLVLSGHTQSNHSILTGNAENKIGWIRTCHHNAKLDSYFRMLLIDTVRGTIHSSFYSPQYEKFWHDPTAPFHHCEKSVPWTQTGFDFGVETTETVIDGNDAKFISLEIPCCVAVGSEFKATATFENTGTTWNADLPQNKYKLGSENPKDNDVWGTNTRRTLVSNNVVSGERYQFEINCTAPENEGYYNFQYRMVQEGVQWFGEFSENRIVCVALNQVANGSFENGDASWYLGSGAIISSDIKRSGNASLMLSGASTRVIQTVKIEKHTNYQISVWAKSDMSEASGNVFFDTNGVFDGHGEGKFEIASGEATEWTQFKGMFNSGNFDSVTLRIFGDDLKGTVYFDDVTLITCGKETSNFGSAKIVNAYTDKAYRFEADVSGFDSNVLDYFLQSIPGWLHFDSNTGILSGTPEKKDIGVHAVTLDVASAEESEKFAFTIRVFETSPYEFWDAEYAIGSKTDDNDNDGLQNLLEFALDGDPDKNDAADKLIRFSPRGPGFDFTFRRHQSTVTYTIKKSTDLINWLDYTTVSDLNGLVGDTCRISIPASEEKQFFKLEVSQ